MARVTVEDCIQQIPNRFELIMLAAHRAHQLKAGDTLTVSKENDKEAILALREIAEKTIDSDNLYTSLVQEYQQSPFASNKSDSNTTINKAKQELLLAYPSQNFDDWAFYQPIDDNSDGSVNENTSDTVINTDDNI